MTTCEDVRGALARLADRDDDGPARADVEAHLAGCAGCREAFEAQRQVSLALRARPDSVPRPDFAAAVRTRLEAGWVGLADWRQWTLRLAPVAAALALAAWLLGAPASQTAVPTLDDWARAAAGTESTARLIWDGEVTSDTLLAGMLDGSTVPAPEANDGR
jgi:anti-sigma factor RsiW